MSDSSATILDNSIARIVSRDATPEQIAQVMFAVQAVARRAKELREALEWAMLAHIEETGEDLVIGDVRYYAGVAKVTKCTSVADTVTSLFRAVKGDEAQFVGALRADPFKPSACKKLLTPFEYSLHFVTEEKPELREGKPQKRLLSTNARFAGESHNDNDD